jgi:Na+-transporting NADH:ubiquinone oxidoreductase subunit A
MDDYKQKSKKNAMRIRIVGGLDIVPAVQQAGEIKDDKSVSVAAVVGSDYHNLRPSFQVDVGDKVAIGQSLFVDSRRPQLAVCSPVGGTVSQIRRGQRRTLDIIEIAREDERSKDFLVPQLSDGEGIRGLLLESGQWPAFRSRPFERIPDPTARPAAIFVTAMDTEPLSADPADVLQKYADAFRTGLLAIRTLTTGPLYVCQASTASSLGEIDRVQFVEFAGPHPAGLPGTHIHHLMPVNRTRHVWHIGYQDVIAIGRLCETGRIWSQRIVSVAGPGVCKPHRIRTSLGSDLGGIVGEERVASDVTIVSGSPLSGHPARFLGRYHTQVSVLLQDKPWNGQGLLTRLASILDGGHAGAIIPIAAHENVMAVNIPPVPLLRALSVGHTETAEQLGCLELAESDMALLTHVCPSKIDYAPLLRKVLDEIESWI